MLASNIENDKAAENDLASLRFLRDDISPAQFKEILNSVDNFLQEDWNTYLQESVSGIGVKVAIADKPIESLSAEKVFNRIWHSVVYIETEHSAGSGVIVQPDIVATNCHVVDDAEHIDVYQPKERRGIEHEPPFSAYPPMRAEGGRDYCLLLVPGLQGSGIPATIRPYKDLKIGETVYALGAPDGEILSLSRGIISQLRDDYDVQGSVIQSDVDIAPGSSGGGLFDSAGNLIGHTTFGSIDEREVDFEGLEFSVPADIVLEFGQQPTE